MHTPKIAIIEDDVAIANMYLMKFSSAGFQVQSAADGKLGLELVEEMRPDIVLLDVRMPVEDGLSALKKLRATTWGADIPVLVLTNVGDETMVREMQKLKVEAFIVKAELTPSQVMTRVTEILEKKASGRSGAAPH